MLLISEQKWVEQYDHIHILDQLEQVNIYATIYKNIKSFLYLINMLCMYSIITTDIIKLVLALVIMLNFAQNLYKIRGFPGGPVVKNLPCNARDTTSIPRLGRSHMPQSN